MLPRSVPHRISRWTPVGREAAGLAPPGCSETLTEVHCQNDLYGADAGKEFVGALEISVSSLLDIASANVSKVKICSTKAPGPKAATIEAKVAFRPIRPEVGSGGADLVEDGLSGSFDSISHPPRSRSS